MNEWGVVLVIISLVGLFAAIAKPILNLNTAIVKLTEAVKELQKDMADFVNGNHNSHVRIHERIDGCNEVIRNHENRLEKLEEKKAV